MEASDEGCSLTVENYQLLREALERSQQLWSKFNDLMGRYMTNPVLYHDAIQLFILRNGEEITELEKKPEEDLELSSKYNQQGISMQEDLLSRIQDAQISSDEITVQSEEVVNLLQKSVHHAVLASKTKKQVQEHRKKVEEDEKEIQKLRKKEFFLRCSAEGHANDPSQKEKMEKEIEKADRIKEKIEGIRNCDFLYMNSWFHFRHATSNRDEIGTEATSNIQYFKEHAPSKEEVHLFLDGFHSLHTCCSQYDKIIKAIKESDHEIATTLFDETFVYSTNCALSETSRLVDHIHDRIKKTEQNRDNQETNAVVQECFPHVEEGGKRKVHTSHDPVIWLRKAVKIVNDMKQCLTTLNEIFTRLRARLNPMCPYNETTENGEMTTEEEEAPPTPTISSLTSSLFGRVSSLATIIRSEPPPREAAVAPVDEATFLYAVNHNRIEVAESILKRDPSFIKVKDDQGWSTLHIACHKNNIEMAGMLLEYGADAKATNESQSTPFHYIVRHKVPLSPSKRYLFFSLLHKLARESGINLRNRSGETPLFYCVYYGCDLDILQFLLSHGACVSVSTKRKMTPAALAALLDRPPKLVEKLSKLQMEEQNMKLNLDQLPTFVCHCEETSLAISLILQNPMVPSSPKDQICLLFEVNVKTCAGDLRSEVAKGIGIEEKDLELAAITGNGTSQSRIISLKDNTFLFSPFQKKKNGKKTSFFPSQYSLWEAEEIFKKIYQPAQQIKEREEGDKIKERKLGQKEPVPSSSAASLSASSSPLPSQHSSSSSSSSVTQSAPGFPPSPFSLSSNASLSTTSVSLASLSSNQGVNWRSLTGEKVQNVIMEEDVEFCFILFHETILRIEFVSDDHYSLSPMALETDYEEWLPKLLKQHKETATERQPLFTLGNGRLRVRVGTKEKTEREEEGREWKRGEGDEEREERERERASASGSSRPMFASRRTIGDPLSLSSSRSTGDPLSLSSSPVSFNPISSSSPSSTSPSSSAEVESCDAVAKDSEKSYISPYTSASIPNLQKHQQNPPKTEIMSPISEEHVTLTRLRKRKMVKPLPMNDMDDLVQDNEL